MGRKNIFETLADNCNAGTALKRIANLFNSPLFAGKFSDITITIEKVVDEFKFCDWKSKGTSSNC